MRVNNIDAKIEESPPSECAHKFNQMEETPHVTLEFAQVVSADYESRRLQNTPSADFRSTGLYAPPGARVNVQVAGVPAAHSKLRLLVGTYSRYDNGGRDPSQFDLQIGENSLTVSQFGGLIYVQYTVEGFPTLGIFRLTFTFRQGFVQAPHYILGRTSTAEWKQQLRVFTNAPDVVLESRRTIMVYSRDNALAWQDNDHDLVLRAADQILNAEDDISGLDGSCEIHRRNPNQFLLTQSQDGWMYMTNMRAAFSAGAAKYAFTPLIISEGWGAWHELGHFHQQSSWKWKQLGEVTVNIYSLAAERALGVTPNGLVRENAWPRARRFLGMADKDFNSDADCDVWVRLCMFRQLWLAYGDYIFHQIHRQSREENPVFQNDDEKIRYFMVKVCRVTGHDLSRFFHSWGLHAPSVYDEIATWRLPLPTTDLCSLQDSAPAALLSD